VKSTSVAGDYHEIIGGMDRLPEAFAERLRTTPRLGCEVVRIEQDAKTASAIYRDRRPALIPRNRPMPSFAPFHLVSLVRLRPRPSCPEGSDAHYARSPMIPQPKC
jgi:hypothetical protein